MEGGERGGFQRPKAVLPAAGSRAHQDAGTAKNRREGAALQDLTIFSDDSYRASGKSTGLARGLLVAVAGGRNLTQDGMGLGSPALKTEHGTYFSRSCVTDVAGDGRVVKVFRMDTELAWGAFGRPSHALTHFFGRIGEVYMHVPPLQIFLPLGTLFRTVGRIRPAPVRISPMAEIVFKYRISGTTVEVSCRIRALQDRLPRIYLLNELGADIFRAGWRDGALTAPPPGWKELPEDSRAGLYAPEHRLLFRISDITTGGTAGHRVYWGRERTRDICWAGFEIEVEPPAGAREIDCRYTISFERSGGTE